MNCAHALWLLVRALAMLSWAIPTVSRRAAKAIQLIQQCSYMLRVYLVDVPSHGQQHLQCVAATHKQERRERSGFQRNHVWELLISVANIFLKEGQLACQPSCVCAAVAHPKHERCHYHGWPVALQHSC